METLVLHTRRSFAKYAGILGLGSMVTFTTACPAWLTTVWNDIKEFAPSILSAVATVLTILTGAGVLGLPLAATISNIIALISKAIADIQTAVNNYQSAPADQKTTVIGVVVTAMVDAEAYIQQFWNDLTIPDPALATTIHNLLGVIVSTLQGYIDSLGVKPTQTPATLRRANLPKLIQVPAKRRSLSQFKTAFNGYLDSTYAQHKL